MSLSKATAVPGAPAFHLDPSLTLLSLGQGEGEQPREHPTLQPGARRSNLKPWAVFPCYNSDSTRRRVWPPVSVTGWLIVHSGFAPLISLISAYTVISCRVIVQAFPFVLVEINFLERHSTSKAFGNIILWWSIFRSEILGGHSISLLALSGLKSCFLFYILT